jgi:hypothetical protein
MARKGKVGLDYFSHDTDMATDIRVKIIMAKHGLDAYGVFNMLLEKLYSEKGYYLQLSDNFDILFIDECKISIDVYILILNACIEQSLFDKGLYKKYNILTSCRIQNNYIAGTERRKEVSFVKEFLLVDAVNAYSERVNVNILSLNANIGTQRKEKEKGKEIEKEKESKPNFDLFWAAYPKKVGKKDAKRAWERAKDKPSIDEIVRIVQQHSISEQWKKDGGQYVPNPATWINRGGWEDEVIQSTASAIPRNESPAERMLRKNREVLAKYREENDG